MREQLYDFLDSKILTRPVSYKYKVLDFSKVVEIIKEFSPIKIDAGLKTDWTFTCVNLYEDGKVAMEVGGGYLGSNWATPAIIITHQDGREEEVDCFVKTSGYNSEMLWSKSDLEELMKLGIKGEINDN